jgi:hypothetical protein
MSGSTKLPKPEGTAGMRKKKTITTPCSVKRRL